jgi:hypothetical protein
LLLYALHLFCTELVPGRYQKRARRARKTLRISFDPRIVSMESLRIYNTLARDKQTFVPLQEGVVRMYVCGMTVYDY